jgi:hypothetical protein
MALGADPANLDRRERVVRTDRDDPDRPRLDRAGRGPQPAGPPWARLARRAEQHGGALLVLSRAPQAGAFAAATVELRSARPRWTGAPGTPGRLLEGAESTCAVARLKNGAPAPPSPIQLCWGSTEGLPASGYRLPQEPKPVAGSR